MFSVASVSPWFVVVTVVRNYCDAHFTLDSPSRRNDADVDIGAGQVTAAIGIIGSLIATYGGKALGIYGVDETAGFIGAIILLILYRLITRGRST